MKTALHATLVLLLLYSTSAIAAPEAGDKTFTLSGSGTSDDDLNNNVFSSNIEVGFFSTNQLEYSLRQTIALTDFENDDTEWNFATRIAADYHFGSAKTFPFVGASFGGVYGDAVDNTFSGGLEFGVKHYALEKTFILALVDYQFFFDSSDEIDNNFDDGAVFYSLGIGFNF